jgi:hypothetical protein
MSSTRTDIRSVRPTYICMLATNEICLYAPCARCCWSATCATALKMCDVADVADKYLRRVSMPDHLIIRVRSHDVVPG